MVGEGRADPVENWEQEGLGQSPWPAPEEGPRSLRRRRWPGEGKGLGLGPGPVPAPVGGLTAVGGGGRARNAGGGRRSGVPP